MKYTIDTNHEKGDTVYYNAEGKIKQTAVEETHSLLRSDGTYVVFYAVDTGEKKYGKPKKDIVEECLLFKTPEEVTQKILQDFNKDKTITND